MLLAQRLTLALALNLQPSPYPSQPLRFEARLAVGRDPLDTAIGGDTLLKAAVHQLGVVALLLHLRWGEGCGVRGRVTGRVRVQGSS